MDEMTPIGRRIRELLDERGWSVLRLSREMEACAGGLASTHYTQLSRWMKDGKIPERPGAEALGCAFGVPPEEFELPRTRTEADVRRLEELVEASLAREREALATLAEAQRTAAEMAKAQRHPQELAKPGSTLQRDA